MTDNGHGHWAQAPGFPTEPGAYWYQPLGLLSAKLLEVRLTNGELTVWRPNQDTPVAILKGEWSGPVKPFSGPLGRCVQSG